MKIERIEATGFLGLAHFAAELTAPVFIVCGPNGAGKSSVLEAVRFALAGESPRVSLKKDLGALVHAGAKDGTVAVTVDGTEIKRSVRTGNCIGGTPDVPTALPYVLGAQALAQLPGTERRRFLFGLAGVSVSPDGVANDLAARGHAPERVARIRPLLRSGFDAAAGEARQLAAEARGGWKEVTGEAYGSVKAATWRAPEVSAAVELVQDADDVPAFRAAYETAVAQASALAARKTAYETAVTHAQRLRARAAKADSVRADLAKMDAWQPAPLGECPQCRTPLALVEGELVVARGVDSPDSLEKTRGIREALRAALRDAEQAEAALAGMGEPPSSPSAEEIRHAHDVVDAARRAVEAADIRRRAIADAHRAAGEQAERTERAKDLHAQACAWSALEAALSPNGLPAELLQRAIGPFNALLAGVNQATGWPLVQVGPDLEVVVGLRAYGLLSESERWRADAALAYAVAVTSGIGLVVLDRLDVLDLPSRSVCLRWLSGTVGLDTVIVAATLKEPPALPAERFNVLWLGDTEQRVAA